MRTPTRNDAKDLWQAIGETPLIRMQALSDLTGCEILGKAEFLNPGGSVKDRAAKGIIAEAERSGALRPGGTIVEGTAGNTGIGLTVLANARGYKSLIVIPDNQSAEKIALLQALGADVRVVPAAPYSKPGNYNHVAKRLAEEIPGAVWANQFDNTANQQIHFETTGPEIWRQTGGRLDAFVAAAGTGGTIAGISRYLKGQSADVQVVLADPLGSALFSYVKTGELDSDGDSVTEGIGIGRITANFAQAQVDDAIQVDDRAMIEMAHFLVRHEGLLLGSSAALNVFAACRVAKRLGPGHTVVTILCDGGQRYLSRLYNEAWLEAENLVPQGILSDLLKGA